MGTESCHASLQRGIAARSINDKSRYCHRFEGGRKKDGGDWQHRISSCKRGERGDVQPYLQWIVDDDGLDERKEVRQLFDVEAKFGDYRAKSPGQVLVKSFDRAVDPFSARQDEVVGNLEQFCLHA